MGTTEAAPSHEPDVHYDRVHEAWRLILGSEFHYGYFVPSGIPLVDATAALTEQMLQRAGITPGARVLDVGCGTGHQSCQLASEHGAEVLGITTSGTGVAAATELAASRGLATARFEQRDGTANGLPDASFDVVWALESSHLMRDRKGLLSESARVLVPGGRFVLCDIIRRREIPFLEVRERRDEFALLRSVYGDAHMLPLDDYAAMLTEVGMEVDDLTDISDETLPTFAAWRANCEEHADEITRLIGADGLDEYVRSTHVLEAFWNDRTLGYGILRATKPA
ncbi:27-O-demethylrifamycin SV methyltransferase [Nocardioides sp. J9]|uniref:methyltransferase domain-containing protein n=1 Tax=unclassified Nocardioides TaxID=2615069 RepID=UPI0004AE6895|nr:MULTISPECIES: methyltransferase domain-containing protein [unclassified Nocardioides]TWG93990.1 27-O-demethylrifamycin SV methyltransferase [Nocardioides sp. J9]